MRKKNIIRKPPTEVHTYRCTEEELKRLQTHAKECGLSLSRYVVETGLKHRPRMRLTKDEVDAKMSSALEYKGSKDTYADLPTTGNKKGDVWNIVNADAAHGVNAGDNVAWNGTTWDVLAGTMDLSAYMLAEDLVAISNTELDNICK